jgi:hypothetical protein
MIEKVLGAEENLDVGFALDGVFSIFGGGIYLLKELTLRSPGRGRNKSMASNSASNSIELCKIIEFCEICILGIAASFSRSSVE